jgi:hypothetical protein
VLPCREAEQVSIHPSTVARSCATADRAVDDQTA